MFTVIINEKGGAERREFYDKSEVSVGRVQGNDLMLPKGNVSKHHARVLFRDSRFIVTDLKSTNGTYVNGRKIAQATPVREGDKVYIGDFVIRLEPGHVAEGASPAQPASSPLVQAQAAAPPVAAPRAVPAPMPMAPAAVLPASPAGAVRPAPSPAYQPPPPRAPSMPPPLGDVPRSRQTAALPTRPPMPSAPQVSLAGQGAPGAQPVAQAAPTSAPVIPPPAKAHKPQAPLTGAPAPARPSMGPTMPPQPLRQPAAQRETVGSAARRLALVTLIDRASDVVNLSVLRGNPVADDKLAGAIDRAVREQAKAMRDEGEAPEGVDMEAVARDALKELVALGPLAALLEEESVNEIYCARFDTMAVLRGSQSTYADVAFSSDDSLRRIIMRLALQAGSPLLEGEGLVVRRLARGVTMTAVVPPFSAQAVLALRRPSRIESSLEENVRTGLLSRPMATFLEGCVTGRANLLVVAESASAAGDVLGALMSCIPPEDRTVLVQEHEVVSAPNSGAIALTVPRPSDAQAVMRAASLLGGDRLFVAPLSGGAMVAVADAVASGSGGVVASALAPSLRQGLARVAGQLVLGRAGTTLDSAKELVLESFDIFVEVSRAPDGRLRVTKIAEPMPEHKATPTRDIFALDANGQFDATGTIPRIMPMLAAAGVRADASLFKKASK
jgi:pilus assembly protein CpaF